MEQFCWFGCKEYSITPQTHGDEFGFVKSDKKDRKLLPVANKNSQLNKKQSIRIVSNHDVGHSLDRDCRSIGDAVKLGELAISSMLGALVYDPHAEPPVYGDCWYNCSLKPVCFSALGPQ